MHHIQAIYLTPQLATSFPNPCRRQGLPVESAEGNVEQVQRALAQGLFANAVRFVGTAYDIKDLRSLGQHTYHLIRNTGPGACMTTPASS